MRVLLADDQLEVRSALRLLLEDEPGLRIVGEAVGAAELFELLGDAVPDLILLDWELPGLGLDTSFDSLFRGRGKPHVIALSGRPEARQSSFQAGADAFVSKGDPPEHLLATVRGVVNGHRPES